MNASAFMAECSPFLPPIFLENLNKPGLLNKKDFRPARFISNGTAGNFSGPVPAHPKPGWSGQVITNARFKKQMI